MKQILKFIFPLAIILLMFTSCAADSKNEDNPVSEDTLEYGNITLNNKAGSTLGGLFCAADDKIFFSNFNDNGYIYIYDSETEKSELVTEMPARFINYYDGKLYFLNVYEGEYFGLYDAVFTGELYCCDTETGECEKLVESRIITGLTVNNEGIYYNQIPTPGSSLDPPELWRLGFGETNPEKCGYSYVLRDEERLVDENGIHELDKNKLSISSDVSLDIDIDEESIKGACTYKNKLITYSNGVLNITDLLDGSLFSVKIRDLEKLNHNIKMKVTDFTILGDYLYIANNSSSLCRICLSDNKTDFIPDMEGKYIFSKLYTDEKDLYALCYGGRPKIVRLEISYDPKINGDIITAKELG